MLSSLNLGLKLLLMTSLSKRLSVQPYPVFGFIIGPETGYFPE